MPFWWGILANPNNIIKSPQINIYYMYLITDVNPVEVQTKFNRHSIPWSQGHAGDFVWIVSPVDTLNPKQNGRIFADDIFKLIFFNENIWISIKISSKFVPNCPINNKSSLVQVMTWRRTGDEPLPVTMMTWLNCAYTWWRHQMETFSALLAICARNSPETGEFSAQRPVTRSLDVFFDVRLIKRLSKHSRGWWFETLSHPLWRHRNDQRIKWSWWITFKSVNFQPQQNTIKRKPCD